MYLTNVLGRNNELTNIGAQTALYIRIIEKEKEYRKTSFITARDTVTGSVQITQVFESLIRHECGLQNYAQIVHFYNHSSGHRSRIMGRHGIDLKIQSRSRMLAREVKSQKQPILVLLSRFQSIHIHSTVNHHTVFHIIRTELRMKTGDDDRKNSKNLSNYFASMKLYKKRGTLHWSRKVWV